LHVADDRRLSEYAPAAWAQSIVQLVDQARPDLVIGTASDRGSEVMAHVGARLKLPVAANAVEILPGDRFTVTRQRWGGSLLEEAVGCSRAVTSLGWRPHADQVGQTGTRIAPDLYIACGISGAIQHMVGCRAAKHILAINTDANAPIVTQADYAVVGDVQKVLSTVNAEVRRVKAGEPSRTAT